MRFPNSHHGETDHEAAGQPLRANENKKTEKPSTTREKRYFKPFIHPFPVDLNPLLQQTKPVSCLLSKSLRKQMKTTELTQTSLKDLGDEANEDHNDDLDDELDDDLTEDDLNVDEKANDDKANNDKANNDHNDDLTEDDLDNQYHNEDDNDDLTEDLDEDDLDDEYHNEYHNENDDDDLTEDLDEDLTKDDDDVRNDGRFEDDRKVDRTFERSPTYRSASRYRHRFRVVVLPADLLPPPQAAAFNIGNKDNYVDHRLRHRKRLAHDDIIIIDDRDRKRDRMQCRVQNPAIPEEEEEDLKPAARKDPPPAMAARVQNPAIPEEEEDLKPAARKDPPPAMAAPAAAISSPVADLFVAGR
jgi:hypothetical protein